ncbi:MAG: MFS transporter [Myxococcota bacterium]
MTSPAANHSALTALRHRDFRLYWFGQATSLVGTMMQRVAVAWQMYELTGSAAAMGLIGACRLVPILVFSLVGGVIADRVDRRRIMMVATSVMVLSSTVLAWATFTGHITPSVLYACVTLTAIADAFNGPARQALVPNLVPSEVLQQALTLSLLTWDVAGVAGPALGGLVLASTGPAFIYALDAVSYLAVIVAVALMRPRPFTPTSTSVGGVQAIREGLRFVFGQPLLVSTMLLDFFATFFGQATVLFPVFAKDVLDVGAEGLGIMYSAPATGSVLTGLVLAVLPPIRKHGRALVISVAVYGLATVVFGLSTEFVWTLGALFVVGAADTVSTMLRQTLRQRLTPDELRGRMTSVNMIFFAGGPQLGEFESGIVAAWLGPALAVTLGGAGVLVSVLVATLRVPALRRYTDESIVKGQTS